MKTQIWHGHKNHTELEDLVNLWLRTAGDQGLTVRDVEYGYTTDGAWGWYSAMAKYEEAAGGENNMQVHIFHGHREHSELETQVNEWLKDAESKGLEVIDIKYGYTTDRTWGWYSAMVIFKNRY